MAERDEAANVLTGFMLSNAESLPPIRSIAALFVMWA